VRRQGLEPRTRGLRARCSGIELVFSLSESAVVSVPPPVRMSNCVALWRAVPRRTSNQAPLARPVVTRAGRTWSRSRTFGPRAEEGEADTAPVLWLARSSTGVADVRVRVATSRKLGWSRTGWFTRGLDLPGTLASEVHEQECNSSSASAPRSPYRIDEGACGQA
jgi:hypothetical protein